MLFRSVVGAVAAVAAVVGVAAVVLALDLAEILDFDFPEEVD